MLNPETLHPKSSTLGEIEERTIEAVLPSDGAKCSRIEDSVKIYVYDLPPVYNVWLAASAHVGWRRDPRQSSKHPSLWPGDGCDPY
jgi:hypothetical protein